jgi:hypothetical protein
VSSRTYWVGLPVGVTVHDDGAVEFEVDISEAGDGISDEWSEDQDGNYDGVSEGRMLLDYAIANAQVGHAMARPTAPPRPYHCPVKYSCPFETESLEDLAGHAAEGTYHGA